MRVTKCYILLQTVYKLLAPPPPVASFEGPGEGLREPCKILARPLLPAVACAHGEVRGPQIFGAVPSRPRFSLSALKGDGWIPSRILSLGRQA